VTSKAQELSEILSKIGERLRTLFIPVEPTPEKLLQLLDDLDATERTAWQPVSSAPYDQDLELAVIEKHEAHCLSFPLPAPSLRMGNRKDSNELLQKRIAEIKAAIPEGGSRAAAIRGLLYAAMSRLSIDERSFEALRRIREAHTEVSLSEFKALARTQYNMLLIDQEAALASIPSMLPPDAETRTKTFDLIRQVLSARGELSTEDSARLAQVGRLFGIGDSGVATPFRQLREKRQPKGT
jgi:hypothetical protein